MKAIESTKKRRNRHVARACIALSLSASVVGVASAPASAVVCNYTSYVSTQYFHLSHSMRPNCVYQGRAKLYYFLSPNGGTMYSATGSWVNFPNVSVASRNNAYYAGKGANFR